MHGTFGCLHPQTSSTSSLVRRAPQECPASTYPPQFGKSKALGQGTQLGQPTAAKDKVTVTRRKARPEPLGSGDPRQVPVPETVLKTDQVQRGVCVLASPQITHMTPLIFPRGDSWSAFLKNLSRPNPVPPCPSVLMAIP